MGVRGEVFVYVWGELVVYVGFEGCERCEVCCAFCAKANQSPPPAPRFTKRWRGS